MQSNHKTPAPFLGLGGISCTHGDIARATNAVNDLDEKYGTTAQIFNGFRKDIKWGCAVEHISKAPAPNKVVTPTLKSRLNQEPLTLKSTKPPAPVKIGKPPTVKDHDPCRSHPPASSPFDSGCTFYSPGNSSSVVTSSGGSVTCDGSEVTTGGAGFSCEGPGRDRDSWGRPY